MPNASGVSPTDATVVTAASGTEIVLELAAAPTTGYVWEPPVIPPGLLLVDRSHTAARAGAVGGAGTETFRVRVTAAGTYDLVFALKRPWETQAARTHTFHITAGP
jgi:predicted secreted protein